MAFIFSGLLIIQFSLEPNLVFAFAQAQEGGKDFYETRFELPLPDEKEKIDEVEPVKGIIPPRDISEKEILELKKQAMKIRMLMEQDLKATTKIRNIPGVFSPAPIIRVGVGYATVITLPFEFELKNVALGERWFTVEKRKNSVIIFPLKPFRTTNLIIYDTEKMEPKQLIITESLGTGEIDITVNIGRGRENAYQDAIINSIMTGKTLNESDVIQNLSQTQFPFIKLLRLASPRLFIFLVEGRYTPATESEWFAYIGDKMTVIAVKTEALQIRRNYDGKIITYENKK
ncbi:MAG: hypothetical protein DDT19_00007 [Syntrophomonadaceae bacterium]|nr:hypothetical protein [Bacillota bacterium]